jgi:lactate dehydrogenase-like 2-hydroxyacid dehydrogenase
VTRVVATRPLLPAVEEELRASFELEIGQDVAGADGLVTVPTDTVDGALLDAAGPQLRIVAQHAVGFDNVDLEAATARGVVVTNTPGVLTAATAEFTLALLLALVRRVAEGDRLVRAREPWSWEPTAMLGTGLAGKTLGLVGRGRIGDEVARLAGALGMRVIHSSRSSGLRLEQLLDEADVVSLHVPLTDETRHLIDAAALARMRPDGVLVNTSRGPVVDEAALADALEAGSIAGAALDVYEREPAVEPRLLALPNVVLTPHVASATVEAREAMGMLCVEALRAVLLEGRVPPNALNPEALSSAP